MIDIELGFLRWWKCGMIFLRVIDGIRFYEQGISRGVEVVES